MELLGNLNYCIQTIRQTYDIVIGKFLTFLYLCDVETLSVIIISSAILLHYTLYVMANTRECSTILTCAEKLAFHVPGECLPPHLLLPRLD